MTENAEQLPSLTEIQNKPRKHRRDNLIATPEDLRVISDVVDHLKAFYGGNLRVLSRILDEKRVAIRVLGNEADLKRFGPLMETYQQATIEGHSLFDIESLLRSQIRSQVKRTGVFPPSENNQ